MEKKRLVVQTKWRRNIKSKELNELKGNQRLKYEWNEKNSNGRWKENENSSWPRDWKLRTPNIR
jgi:hypothetical protein